MIRSLRYGSVLGRLFDDGEELSIGEWQKVALARVFASDADLLVVDEPTSAIPYREGEAVPWRSRPWDGRAIP